MITLMPRIKKYLPFILIGVGLLIIVGAILFVINSAKKATSGGMADDSSVPELPQSQWPLVSLLPVFNSTIPNSLGHLLLLKVEKINVPEAASMDYELLYSTTDGGQQGVPGTVQLTGTSVERQLLLGSESSGKYRFDEGVDHGTITIRFRDASGKLMGKLSTNFTLSSPSKDVYEVNMDTFAGGQQTFSSANSITSN